MSDAERLMLDFAARTGLTTQQPPKRYLWTDAFAVCNFLGLDGATASEEARRLAVRLIDQVHHVLGHHRDDDPRRGWISGLDEERGARHPTIGGLRIGKELPERQPSDPFDDALEWERDGQYFHYLTKWMYALERAAHHLGEAKYHRWAVELARTAHARFTFRGTDGRQRMYWKMSIDLSRPLVPSMGHHDPLDAFVTFCQLAAHSRADPALTLDSEISDAARMCAGQSWATGDTLGIGGLLTDACRLAQLAVAGGRAELALVDNLLQSAAQGLEHATASRFFRQPADYRLGFRELGLAIGIRATAVIERLVAAHQHLFASRDLTPALRSLAAYRALADEIETFWLDPAQRSSRTWTDHRDINDVMLATCLAPDGYLAIPS
jgi:hypothetical protein